ncbi:MULTISPECIES: CDP-diacylglycerol--serine O-phosphatidyltransferase [unclassified Colwellia]|jgi:CDP-diacylglycerol--serine O-phosphatidyltransferase|uniref:CDP-diacylglycerol--serine O-phosphatidyltransferase n=1 Tax=unclassified Colwellia TaxID=196834 RepID=UPI0015F53876|nr:MULTISPECIES: CDP-diacylglycerol--serine O-phosphatidyltransferase [unclassified Colwellia]MBA6338741.1 CDP-diacylglycerol--serine O-phosphatidyltransferase [Colwellia sp. BRX8-7]MBA6349587.1 CDP-diacylglycerol--serine O-phosphatidyltransferase [Colwellia sp. BRX8-9]MBA6354027.1 CDP-diacylglycerol--serine O-phosphatidyltransferase [Colwellia sp. BRX9-1]MBA6357641.1 CDP-diacylglycerol--serine O-phosphatidyltransferase [Colwellia sp. BRX8-3]MBA6361356.1 CDP-diacylglycerol--serine O-phosphatid
MNKVLAGIPLLAENITVLSSAKQYATALVRLIESAQSRIYITALYLQDDAAGQQVLHALYQAKQTNPHLDIKVFVDFHRAQRGLIGDKSGQGNRDFYLEVASQYSESIAVYGVPVKRKELMGVWHFKGMIFDNTLLYTGASINDIYLHQAEKYRLDRYYQIQSPALCESFCQFLQQTFVKSEFSPQLNVATLPNKLQIKNTISKLKALLKTVRFNFYAQKPESLAGELSVVPLIGFGRRKNQLNQQIRETIRLSKKNLLIFTPYFNLPKPVMRDLRSALKRGVEVTIIIGDKKANDFFIADEDKFSTIGIIPYIYETLLKAFLKRQQKYIDNKLLKVRLWKHESNSFHLKGIVADERWHILTGNNLNPRAWGLDLENGLLIDDAKQNLLPTLTDELAVINQHTTLISSYLQLESQDQYPEKPKKLLKKLRMAQIDRLLKLFL